MNFLIKNGFYLSGIINFVNFENLSHKLLYNQKLYNKYLANYDYKGLFTDVPTEYNVNHFGK